MTKEVDEVIARYLDPRSWDTKTRVAILVGKYSVYRYNNWKMASKIKSKIKKVLGI
jgi:hypothetical protein